MAQEGFAHSDQLQRMIGKLPKVSLLLRFFQSTNFQMKNCLERDFTTNSGLKRTNIHRKGTVLVDTDFI